MSQHQPPEATAVSRAHHLITGGQRSGKSSQAERLAVAWAAERPGRELALIATARGDDEDMRRRIARHRTERPASIASHEVPLALAEALARLSAPQRLLVVDCLTLWLTNWLMPSHPPTSAPPEATNWPAERDALLFLLPTLPGPVIFVTNEIGCGVVPLGEATRAFVDELGRLNQAVAARCGRLSLMVAGQAWSREVAP